MLDQASMEEIADGVKELCKPCCVVLKRLTEDEIQRYTPVRDKGHQYNNEKQQNNIAEQYLQDVPYVEANQNKKTAQKSLKKKLRQSSDSGEFFSDELSDSDEEYRPDVPGTSSRSHKKKRPAYEDDFEWCPNSDSKYNRTEKRSLRKSKKTGLRINTRRKRIESSSSSYSDEDDFVYYNTEYQDEKESITEYAVNPVINNELYNPVKSINGTTEPLKKKTFNTSFIEKRVSNQPDDQSMTLLDHDVLSKLMQEMEDVGNRNQEQNYNFGESNKSEVSNSDTEMNQYPKVKNRKSRVFKITDEGLTPSVDYVQKIIKKMVNAVCDSEEERLAEIKDCKICKWCESPFPYKNDNHELCIICRDVVKLSSKNSAKSSKKVISSSVRTNAKYGTAKGKIKSKLFQNLPKCDQQRLVYSRKADKLTVAKGYNHCKSFTTPSVNSNDLNVSPGSSEIQSGENSATSVNNQKIVVQRKRKVKENAGVSLESKILKKKKIQSESKKVSKLSKSVTQTSSPQTVNNVVALKKNHMSAVGTNADKSLFSITFPVPHQDLAITGNLLHFKPLPVCEKNVIAGKSDKLLASSSLEKQMNLPLCKPDPPVTSNLQYGTYLLPPVPTVVVANYANTDAKSGDYYLSSIYYQNEMTRSKNISLCNDTSLIATNSVSLPSMPSIDQLSHMSSSAVDIPHSNNLNSVPNSTVNFDIGSNVDVSNAVLINQQTISNKNISTSTYSSETNINKILNSSSLSITAIPQRNSSALPESVITSLLKSSQFSIESFPPKASDATFNSFGNSEPTASLEDSSTLATQDYSEDNLHASVEDSLFKKTCNSSPHNVTFENTAQTKQSDAGNNSVSNQNSSKVPEQNLDSNQSPSVPSSNPEKNGYLQDIQHLSSENLLDYCSAELNALCILGVVDLDRNPKWTLCQKIESNKNECEKLKNAETQNEETKKKLKYLEFNGYTLQIAFKLLEKFGSFTKLSDSLLWKARLLQIKKEKILENEETKSSCQFAKGGPFPPQPNQSELLEAKENVSIARLKMANSCPVRFQSSTSSNHIEKIQTQIQAMQGSSLLTRDSGNTGAVHNFAAPDKSVVHSATMLTTPRTEILNEFRETPSRGSGPRTPARPESAMSQNDEGLLTPLQVKKERLETPSSPISQCAFSQSSPSPQFSVATSSAPQIPPPLNNLSLSITPMNPVVNTINQRLQTATRNVPITYNNQHIQKMMQFPQTQIAPPNVTVPFSTNQNFPNVFSNISSKQLLPQNASANMNPIYQNTNASSRNNQMFSGNQVYLSGTPNVTQTFVQPSTSVVSSNIYPYNYCNQTMTSGGPIIINSMSNQNSNPLSNSMTNLPVLNPQQVSQVLDTSSFQQTMQQIPSPAVQPSSNTAFLTQNNKQDDSTSKMFCAVCYQPANLRCKQCAKVAYCNTVCAKTYWRTKHKMECKPMSG